MKRGYTDWAIVVNSKAPIPRDHIEAAWVAVSDDLADLALKLEQVLGTRIQMRLSRDPGGDAATISRS